MADKPFRVLLDLTDLHIENFKYVWINVAPRELKTISDLKKYVLQKLNLERDDIKLFVRDGLLLEDETIIILREEDTIKVQYAVQCPSLHIAGSCGKEAAKSSRKRNHSTSSISDLPENTKRHKSEEHVENNDSGEVDIGKVKSKKKKKKSHSLTADNNNSCNTENCSFVVENSHNEEKSHKKKKLHKSSILDHSADAKSFENTENSFFSFEITQPTVLVESLNQKSASEVSKTNNSANDSTFNNTHMGLDDVSQNKNAEGSTNNCPKKKRKRRRKRKNPAVVDICIGDEANDNITSLPKCEAGTLEMMHSIHSSSQNESQESSLVNEYNPSQPNTFIKEIKCIETKVQASENYPKVSTPAQSNNCDDPSWHVSLMRRKMSVDSSETSSKKELIVHRKPIKNYVVKTNNQTKSIPEKKSMNFFSDSFLTNKDHSLLKSVSTANGNEPAIVVKPISKDNENPHNSAINESMHGKHYLELPDLNCMPNVGTHIAYKTLELDENYSPAISDYREGIVKNINPVTEEIEIELIKTLIKPGRIGKFENLREDETPLPEVKTCDTVKWSSIISPKCLSSL